MRTAKLLSNGVPVLAAVLLAAAAGAMHPNLVDLLVYRHGGQAVLDGLPVYARDPESGLRFTYPPFAALLMVPLALVPARLAAAVWTGVSAAALAGVIFVVRRELGRPTPGWLVMMLACGAVAVEPVWQTLRFGQVNLVLMLLVLIDLVRPTGRWSGVLVGIAAGVKLTPLMFVALCLLAGRRATAARAALAFASTVAVGFAVAPGSAVTYWTDGLADASRVGPPALAHNQSVYGALTRLLEGRPPTGLWVVIAGLTAGAVLVLGSRWWRRGDRMLAICLAALAMLIASPVSWSHHWVWALPTALLLWQRSRWLAAGWIAIFVSRPIVWPPYGRAREYQWDPLEHVLGNAYLLAALAFAVCAAATARSPAVLGGGTSPADRE